MCFGEIVFDMLPHGEFIGGAPLNAAVHLCRLGANALPVSAVGFDSLGEFAANKVKLLGFCDRFVSITPRAPTGIVTVSCAGGQPTFEIARESAWDYIPCDGDLLAAACQADAIIFGTLALRGEGNRKTLAAMLNAATGFVAMDVNFRPPYDDVTLAYERAKKCDLVKLNRMELAQMLGNGGVAQTAEEAEAGARGLLAQTGAKAVCVTADSLGAGLLRAGAWTWEETKPVKVADAVGAGDALFARLLYGLLCGESDADALRKACRLAEYVATQPGAIPELEDYSRV